MIFSTLACATKSCASASAKQIKTLVKNPRFGIDSNKKMTTFMNPYISDAKALDGFSTGNNRVVGDVSVALLAAGFKAFGGYNTVELNSKSSLGMTTNGVIAIVLLISQNTLLPNNNPSKKALHHEEPFSYFGSTKESRLISGGFLFYLDSNDPSNTTTLIFPAPDPCVQQNKQHSEIHTADIGPLESLFARNRVRTIFQDLFLLNPLHNGCQ